ncbi:MAG: hypothetical protein DRH24_14135 [Deltaproteobacteria bacterium]|nr:MAG: hypothetical protein DRH24_14135 [Deltaproteobacteria bacterium]
MRRRLSALMLHWKRCLVYAGPMSYAVASGFDTELDRYIEAIEHYINGGCRNCNCELCLTARGTWMFGVEVSGGNVRIDPNEGRTHIFTELEQAYWLLVGSLS